MRYAKIVWAMVVGVTLSFSAGCATNDGVRGDDPSVQANPDTATPEAAELAVPDALRAVTPAVTCSSTGASCLVRTTCTANGGHLISASGCATGTGCCSFDPCRMGEGSCLIRSTCTANGGHNVSSTACATGLGCCVF